MWFWWDDDTNVLQGAGTLSFNSIQLSVVGQIALHMSPKSTGMFESMYSSIKPVRLLRWDVLSARVLLLRFVVILMCGGFSVTKRRCRQHLRYHSTLKFWSTQRFGGVIDFAGQEWVFDPIWVQNWRRCWRAPVWHIPWSVSPFCVGFKADTLLINIVLQVY